MVVAKMPLDIRLFVGMEPIPGAREAVSYDSLVQWVKNCSSPIASASDVRSELEHLFDKGMVCRSLDQIYFFMTPMAKQCLEDYRLDREIAKYH